MSNWRVPVVILTALVAIALVGGALLWAKTDTTASANSHLICAFGQAIGAQPVKQNHAETDEEFRQRITATRTFLAAISGELKDCHVPTKLRIDPSSEGALKGVGASNGNSNSPSGLPGPSPGGPTEPAPKAPEAPSQPVSPPPNTSSPQLLPEVTKPVCDLTGSLNLPLCH